jgi:putative hydrolase of the HAD superfamily
MPAQPLISAASGPDFRHVDVWIFDLDNTLYDASSGVFPQIDRNMKRFLMAEFGLDEARAHAYQKELYRDYGTTLAGLMARHGLKPERFLDHVHDIDLAELAADAALGAALKRLPGRKAIFTNASRGHAEAIAARLGVLDHFDAIFDIVSADYRPKPDPLCYGRVLGHYAAEGRQAAMFEDIKRNLKPAAELGMTTVWIANDAPWGTDGLQTTADIDDHVHHQAEAITAFLDSLDIGDHP